MHDDTYGDGRFGTTRPGSVGLLSRRADRISSTRAFRATYSATTVSEQPGES